jgi:hypothetical protein
MPRVVPSQVIAFIDTIPLPPAEGFTTIPYSIDTAEFSGLADLLDQIPGELLTMDAATYASFVCSKSRINRTLSMWDAQPRGQEATRLLSPEQADAIRGIREALAKCPDESPGLTTSELNFINDLRLRTVSTASASVYGLFLCDSFAACICEVSPHR